jgi:hypothetical protein
MKTFDDKVNTQSSSCSMDSLEATLDYNDDEPSYSFITNYDEFNEYVEMLEEISTEQRTSLYPKSSNNNQMEIEPPSPTNSEASVLNSTDEIYFDQKEWLIRHPPTDKIRPPKLYEFLHLLLNNSRYSSYASWLNRSEGLFQIHKPSEVTKLWERIRTRRTSSTMNFDKFSRNIRCQYHKGMMIPTRKKHTYRFAINQ